MLNKIKALINEKTAFNEAASLILENDELDDSIILNEGPAEQPEFTPPEDGEGDGAEPAVTKPVSEPTPGTEDPTSVEENPLPLPGNDDLPDSVGKQTGEPAVLGDGDLMNVEIDLATNTQTDTLPIPPANAGDAIEGSDDLMKQHIDSGFGGDSGEEPTPNPVDNDDVMNMSIDDEPKDGAGEGEPEPAKEDGSEGGDLMSEAITVGNEPAPEGDPTTDAGTGDATADPASTDTPPVEGEGDPAQAEENPVTSAVKDKVAEMDDEAPGAATDPNAAKELLLKKLGSLTKGLEDTKKAVMDNIR